jgi:hypothetical protein
MYLVVRISYPLTVPLGVRPATYEMYWRRVPECQSQPTSRKASSRRFARSLLEALKAVSEMAYRLVSLGDRTQIEKGTQASIRLRRDAGRISVHTSLMYARHSSLEPENSVAVHPFGISL